MTEPAKIVVVKRDWDDLWKRYRTLIGGTLETLLTPAQTETVMRDFERLCGECEGERTYWEFQRDRLDAIYKRRNVPVEAGRAG